MTCDNTSSILFSIINSTYTGITLGLFAIQCIKPSEALSLAVSKVILPESQSQQNLSPPTQCLHSNPCSRPTLSHGESPQLNTPPIKPHRPRMTLLKNRPLRRFRIWRWRPTRPRTSRTTNGTRKPQRTGLHPPRPTNIRYRSTIVSTIAQDLLQRKRTEGGSERRDTIGVKVFALRGSVVSKRIAGRNVILRYCGIRVKAIPRSPVCLIAAAERLDIVVCYG